MLPYDSIVHVYLFCFVFKTIVIDFDYLSLETSNICIYDNITIYDQRYLTDNVW